VRADTLPHVRRSLAGGLGGAGSARHERVLTTPERHSRPGRQLRPHRTYYPSYQSSPSPWPPNSTMSCWAERSSAEARPLPLCPRLRARRRRSWRAVAMTRCARASSGSVATSSFHSVRDNRAASTSMLLRKDASSLSDGGDWCLIPCLGFGAGRCSGAAGIGAGAPKKSACRRSAFGLRATFWPFPPGWTPRWHSRFVGSTRSKDGCRGRKQLKRSPVLIQDRACWAAT